MSDMLEQARTVIEQDAIRNQKRINKIFDITLVAIKALEWLAINSQSEGKFASMKLEEIDNVWKSKN